MPERKVESVYAIAADLQLSNVSAERSKPSLLHNAAETLAIVTLLGVMVIGNKLFR